MLTEKRYEMILKLLEEKEKTWREYSDAVLAVIN